MAAISGSMLAGCSVTVTSGPTIGPPTLVEGKVVSCCMSMTDRWQLEGVFWATQHALAELCSCPRAKGTVAAKVEIRSTGSLAAVELTSMEVSSYNDEEVRHCVQSAIEHAFHDYLAMQPGEYALAALADERSPSHEVHALQLAALSCATVSRSGPPPLPNALQGWRFVAQRITQGRPPCHHPPPTVIATVAFDLE